jgi:MFS family permease
VYGRRRVLFLGMISTCVSMIGFGCLNWINDKSLFIILSFVFRFCGGIGSGAIHVSSYAMVALEYPDNLTQNIGILEAAGGAGLFLGPVIGGVIFAVSNIYALPFFIITGSLAIFIPYF